MQGTNSTLTGLTEVGKRDGEDFCCESKAPASYPPTPQPFSLAISSVLKIPSSVICHVIYIYIRIHFTVSLKFGKKCFPNNSSEAEPSVFLLILDRSSISLRSAVWLGRTRACEETNQSLRLSSEGLRLLHWKEFKSQLTFQELHFQ